MLIVKAHSFHAFTSFVVCLSYNFYALEKDLKVWRTDPGSIFDIDPLEDNIQSRSLHMLSGIAYILTFPQFSFSCLQN